eukprot:gene36203-40954_t
MDRMTSLRVFREVVESGSFVAAAERLGLSAPMASKHVAQLEKSLGARLLHRSSRHLSLTEAGTAWYEQSRRALDLLDAADVPVMAMHTLESVLSDPHLMDAGFFTHVDHPSEGRLVRMANPVQMSGAAVEITRHAPVLGEHTVEVLQELGVSDERIAHLLDR